MINRKMQFLDLKGLRLRNDDSHIGPLSEQAAILSGQADDA